MIELEGWSYVYPGQTSPILAPISGRWGAPGSLTLLRGPTGCGKSTLLKSLAGLATLAGGASVGRMRAPTARIALVPQCAEDRYLCDTPRQEAMLTAQLGGMSPGAGRAAWDRLAAELGLAAWERRPFRRLSGGQRKQASIALGLLRAPRILLLDEPLTQLDAAERERTAAWIDRLRDGGDRAIIVAEHRAEPWEAFADARWDLAPEDVAPPLPREPLSPAGKELLVADRAAYAYPGETTPVFADFDFALRAGEIVGLVGANASGKSTILQWLAGLHDEQETFAERIGIATAEVGYLPQNPVDFFLGHTLTDEFRLSGVPRAALDRFGLAGLAERHPQDLSVGQQQQAALALLFGGAYRALLLDEPTHGLDAAAKDRLATNLRAKAREGVGIVLSSHDLDFVDAVAARVVRR